ncbi:hypothetical protein SAMN05443287_10891 [Micromonospora phaseoli]|uniref:PknH-like extracellular domain-containing protein n=2 Tax=Micromonospora phaseoli TaxID=1144548 RepID=A0A1H7BWU4_9ACTN|nr:hypothetical protein CLV64_110193 [Micromonospora phaseoli]GIJ76573.1 hypothetical protein Xph01_10050 [Micromonospora phaseoli]SEJ82133.1 hypothetical protein SAMN05443287_10891 [Micromonospora phaseoli]
MRKKRTVVTLAAVALAALTTLFLAGNGAATAGSQEAAAAPTKFNNEELRQMLVPESEQRKTASSVQPTITIAEAVRTGQFGTGPGIASEPRACLEMTTALGDLSGVEGYMHSGERSQAAAPESLQRYFMTAVFQIPGGASTAIDKVAKVLRTCSAGTIRLDTGSGESLRGSISYAEHEAPALNGARTFASTLTTILPWTDPASTDKTVQTLQECDAQLTLAANGDLLIWSVEPTEQLAVNSVRTVHERALALS